MRERSPLVERHLSLEAEPNPFRGQVSLRLAARAGTQACPYRPEVRIYDVNGALVRDFNPTRSTSAQAHEACPYDLIWDGTDGMGRRLPAGVYVVRLTDGANSVNRRSCC